MKFVSQNTLNRLTSIAVVLILVGCKSESGCVTAGTGGVANAEKDGRNIVCADVAEHRQASTACVPVTGISRTGWQAGRAGWSVESSSAECEKNIEQSG